MNQEVDEKRKVYHYLHNSASGTTIANLLAPEVPILVVNLPVVIPKLSKTIEIRYQLDIDSRDQRTLVVFDGHIPWGGIPKGGDVVFLRCMGKIEAPIQSIRKVNIAEEDSLLKFGGTAYSDMGACAYLGIFRYFLLLPKSVSCVRRYDNRSLRPIYTFIEVDEKGVTWRNSSY